MHSMCSATTMAGARWPVTLPNGWTAGMRGSGRSAGPQGHRRDASRDIEPLVGFDAERLQHDRIEKSADQPVRADSKSNSGAGGAPGVAAGKRAGSHIRRRGDHRPDQRATLRVAEIDPELVDRADIPLR